MRVTAIYGAQWTRARTHLPFELEDIARQTKAVVRRREIANGEMLLRVLLTYASSGWTLEKTVSWLGEQGWARMNASALFFRLRGSSEFLSRTLASMIQRGVACEGRRLKIVDATSLSCPGTRGTDYRVHVVYNPATGAPFAVQVSGAREGESFVRHQFSEGDLVLGDRGYSRARGIHHVIDSKADVLVRVHTNAIRLLDADGVNIDWRAREACVPEVGSNSFWVRLPVPSPNAKSNWPNSAAVAWHDVRIIGARTGKGDVVWLVTNLSAEDLSDEEALLLYRKRWQVELFFKRLKSLADLDEIPNKDPSTTVSWILLKLIGALLAMNLTSEVFSPWGYEPAAQSQPVEAIQRRRHRVTQSTRRGRPPRSTRSSQTCQAQTLQAAAPTLTLEA